MSEGSREASRGCASRAYCRPARGDLHRTKKRPLLIAAQGCRFCPSRRCGQFRGPQEGVVCSHPPAGSSYSLRKCHRLRLPEYLVFASRSHSIAPSRSTGSLQFYGECRPGRPACQAISRTGRVCYWHYCCEGHEKRRCHVKSQGCLRARG